MKGEVRLEDLLGREVLTANNQRAGRLEEIRADTTGKGAIAVAFVIGVAGLFERLGLGAKLVVGVRGGGHVARWDQLDFTDPQRPRLTCPLEELETI